MSNNELPNDWGRLVKESLALAGFSPSRIDSSSRANHFTAALILSRASHFVHPCLVNGVLTGRKGKWFRDGIPSNLRGYAPDGELIPAFMEIWVHEVENSLTEADTPHHEWAREAREEFTLDAHYKIALMRPFKEANGRTAHLMLNHLRARLGLPVHIVEYKDEQAYLDRLKKYRRNVFIPWMEGWSVIIRRRLAFAELCRDKKKNN